MTKIIKLPGNINALIDKNKLTAKIVQSPKAKGDIIIPRYIKHKFKLYLVTRIAEYAFQKNKELNSLAFAPDSAVESIGLWAFCYSSIVRLELPASIERLDEGWCTCADKLIEVQTPPECRFSWVDHNYLVGKKNDSQVFNIILFARRNIENITIPKTIRFIRERAFQNCTKLESISFEPDSTLEKIDNYSFENCNSLKTIQSIPESVKTVGSGCFYHAIKLQSIEFLSSRVDIHDRCFSECPALSHVSCPNATEVIIHTSVFNEVSKNFSIILPKDARIGGKGAKDIERARKNVGEVIVEAPVIKPEEPSDPKASFPPLPPKTGTHAHHHHSHLPHHHHVRRRNSTQDLSKYQKNSIEELLKHIKYLETKLSKYEAVTPFSLNSENPAISLSDKARWSTDEDDPLVHLAADENDVLSIGSQSDSKLHGSSGFFSANASGFIIEKSDLEYHKTIKTLYDGKSFTLYKVLDTRKNRILCKKVLKYNPEVQDPTQEEMQEACKRLEILHAIHHPSVRSIIGISAENEYLKDCLIGNNGIQQNNENNLDDHAIETELNEQNSNENDSNDDEIQIVENDVEQINNDNEDDSTSEKNNPFIKLPPKSELFLEFMEQNLKDYIVTNPSHTLKARIAVEIASGMMHLHRLGMVHGNLRVDNIMLNSVYEAKIIDFSQLQILQQFETKLVPSRFSLDDEILKEKIRNDVFGYGKILYYIFSGKHFEDFESLAQLTPSNLMTQFCIDLVKQCLSVDPSQRLTFEEILNQIRDHSFALASDVNSDIVERRYKVLEKFNSFM